MKRDSGNIQVLFETEALSQEWPVVVVCGGFSLLLAFYCFFTKKPKSGKSLVLVLKIVINF
jgi:hypothetical protein